VKKEGCERPLSEAKVPERPLFSRVLSHKTMFFFYFPFMLNPWETTIQYCFNGQNHLYSYTYRQIESSISTKFIKD